MSQAQPEPSMEEILASIRRIISEDGEEAPAAAQKPRPTAAAPAKPAAAPPPQRARLFEPEPAALQVPAFEDKAKTHLETEDVEMVKKSVAENLPEDVEEAMLSDTTAAVTTKAFQNLSQSMRIGGEGRTLEDIVTDILRPLIKDWLDAHLSTIVEEKVEEEIQRVARRRR